jgi:hypothetical protein
MKDSREGIADRLTVILGLLGPARRGVRRTSASAREGAVRSCWRRPRNCGHSWVNPATGPGMVEKRAR